MHIYNNQTCQTSCLTTQLPYKLYVSPHSYHTNFMSHHTLTIQTSCLTTQLPYKFHVSSHSYHTLCLTTVTTQNMSHHSCHTNFMSHHSYHTNFMSHHSYQTLCLTSYHTKLYASPHSHHTIFMSHHTVTKLYVSPVTKLCLTIQLPYKLRLTTVTIQSSCLTTITKLCLTTVTKLYVSPHSYHTIFMSHHTHTIQSLCPTTQLPNFKSHHTVTIQNTTYFQWLSHTNFTSIMHTKILYPKLPNLKDL